MQRNTRAVLKDPDSARFGAMAASKTADNIVYVCGTVNARNSFGGYTGAQPFTGVMTTIGSTTLFRPIAVGGQTTHKTIAFMCRHYGVI